MAMLKLDAYKVGVLQDCKALLLQAKKQGLSIEAIINEINSTIPVGESFNPFESELATPLPPADLCPSCGHRMSRVRLTDGETLQIQGCKACRYSEVIT